jgi:hypothetical protein
MNAIDLRNQIDTLAWGPRGTDELREATVQSSPAMVVKLAFEHMKDRQDLVETEIELLRSCCKIIRDNQWFGLVKDASIVEAGLPAIMLPSGE